MASSSCGRDGRGEYRPTFRFREREYEEGREGTPHFRGPEGSIDYDINELKKFTIEIMRMPSSVHGDTTTNRSITNPNDTAQFRRPEGVCPTTFEGQRIAHSPRNSSDSSRSRTCPGTQSRVPRWYHGS